MNESRFEELSARKQNLSFNSFFQMVKQKWKIENLNKDILKTLGFYTKEGELNHAAVLFSDQNDFAGIDIVRFGRSISEIFDRETLINKPILEIYNQAIAVFEKYYIYEKIEGIEREVVERIPLEAFRETLANALVHRVWDMPSHIRIAMYTDKIEIYSPGGLPSGISEEEYLMGYLSRLRNPIVANVFFRLGLIEMFGTGIRRIMEIYTEHNRKPIFKVSENNICVILPTIDEKKDVTLDEELILEILSSGIRLSSSEIAFKSNFSKNKVVRVVNSLLEKHYIQKEGSGRGTKYYV